MDFNYRLIQLLADGEFHSGRVLGEALGVSRSAIWKMMQQLDKLGLVIDKAPKRGYRLVEPIELLDAEKIQAELSPRALEKLQGLVIVPTIDSTNQYLLDAAREGDFDSNVCIAERQTAGRGRRGRAWLSPFAGQLPLSLRWSFAAGATTLAGLSIAVGLAVIKGLESFGIDDVMIKWPNDLYYQGKKLAGILVEAFVDGLGVCHAVIGLGLNITLSTMKDITIEQAWTDLQSIAKSNISRNKLAACLLQELFMSLAIFETEGLAPFQKLWKQYDLLANQSVTVFLQNEEVQGQAIGIDSLGGLNVLCDDGVKTFHAGEVSVRQAK